MENFSRLAAFDFSPLPQDTDESADPPSYLDRLTSADPDAYRHESAYSTTNGHPGFRSFLNDSDTRSSVDSWSSVYSRQASTPFSTIDDSDFSSTSGFDSRSSTSEPHDADPSIDNKLYNANGKRDNQTPSDVTTAKKRKLVTGNYTRHVDKPPYRYLGLIITAIQASPDKALTLGGVHSWFRQNFEFFRGKYTGWRDSVRHTLSSSRCFYKETRDPVPGQIRKPQNYWKVDLSIVTDDVFRLQESQLGKTGFYAPYIHEELGIPPVQLPPKTECSLEEDVKRKITVLKQAGIAKSKTTKKRKSGDKANVKLPKKFQKQNNSVTESPEVLRHTSSTDQKVDIPAETQNASDINRAIDNSLTEQESLKITPALSEVLGCGINSGTDTPTRNAVHDAVKNLSLLCDPSQDRLDLNTSFLEREEDQCPDMSPTPQVNNSTDKTVVNSPISSAFSIYQRPAMSFVERPQTSESFYPVFHQASTCSGQDFSPVFTPATSSPYSDREPVFLHHYPVVCHFQTPSTPTYCSQLQHSSLVSPFVPIVSSYTPYVPIVSSYTRYPVLNSAVHSRYESVRRPRSVSPDEEFSDVSTVV